MGGTHEPDLRRRRTVCEGRKGSASSFVSRYDNPGDQAKRRRERAAPPGAAVPFLRRHDPDQVDKGSAQYRLSAVAHPSEEIDFIGEFKTHVNRQASNVACWRCHVSKLLIDLLIVRLKIFQVNEYNWRIVRFVFKTNKN